jgi:hypothetical protein
MAGLDPGHPRLAAGTQLKLGLLGSILDWHEGGTILRCGGSATIVQTT